MTNALQCPKCGYSPKPTDKFLISQCVSCGIVFEKYHTEQDRLQRLTPKRAPKPVEGTPKPNPVVTIILCGAVFALAWAYGSRRAKDDSPPQPKYNSHNFDAQYRCKNFVLEQLKAPSSAAFPTPVVSGSGEGPYTVRGAVDSQNSFGAMLRSQYICEVEFHGNTAALLSLNFQ